jgi:hypothetical protein
MVEVLRSLLLAIYAKSKPIALLLKTNQADTLMQKLKPSDTEGTESKL